MFICQFVISFLEEAHISKYKWQILLCNWPMLEASLGTENSRVFKTRRRAYNTDISGEAFLYLWMMEFLKHNMLWCIQWPSFFIIMTLPLILQDFKHLSFFLFFFCSKWQNVNHLLHVQDVKVVWPGLRTFLTN